MFYSYNLWETVVKVELQYEKNPVYNSFYILKYFMQM